MNKLNKKYGSGPRSKSRKKQFVIAMFIIILLIGVVLGLSYLYPNISNDSFEECDAVIVYLDGYMSNNLIRLNISLENSLSDICSYSLKDESYFDESSFGNYSYNRTYYNISSCDLEKIKNGLDNANSLNLDDLKTYVSVSNHYGFRKSTSHIKDIFIDEFSSGCNQIKSISSLYYSIILIATNGMTNVAKKGRDQYCLYSNQTTEVEKKECLISVLNAYESTANYYATLDYSGNISRCILLGDVGEESISLSDVMMARICQKMISYRSELVDKIKDSDMDYNQRYLIFISFLLQNRWLGGEDLDWKDLERDLIERIPNSKYKAEFIENYENAYLEEY